MCTSLAQTSSQNPQRLLSGLRIKYVGQRTTAGGLSPPISIWFKLIILLQKYDTEATKLVSGYYIFSSVFMCLPSDGIWTGNTMEVIGRFSSGAVYEHSWSVRQMTQVAAGARAGAGCSVFL